MIDWYIVFCFYWMMVSTKASVISCNINSLWLLNRTGSYADIVTEQLVVLAKHMVSFFVFGNTSHIQWIIPDIFVSGGSHQLWRFTCCHPCYINDQRPLNHWWRHLTKCGAGLYIWRLAWDCEIQRPGWFWSPLLKRTTLDSSSWLVPSCFLLWHCLFSNASKSCQVCNLGHAREYVRVLKIAGWLVMWGSNTWWCTAMSVSTSINGA